MIKPPRKKRGKAKLRVMLAEIRDSGLRRRLRAASPRIELVGASRGEPPAFVLMQWDQYRRLREKLEDKEAEEAFARTKDEERVPIEVADRLLRGENPIHVWREHRGVTLAALGARARLSKSYLSDLEAGKRSGPVKTLRAIARALDVDLEDIA